MNIERVGVIGAGTMGNGIAQACAAAGVGVVMVDVAQAAVDRCKRRRRSPPTRVRPSSRASKARRITHGCAARN